MQSTTDVDPPGRHARHRPTGAQIAAVQATLRQHNAELIHLERKHVAALYPIMHEAQVELSHRLRGWIETAPNGELRFTAWKYRSALLQTKKLADEMSVQLFGELKHGGRMAQGLSLKHLTTEVARFSTVFGDHVPSLPLKLASLMAHGEKALVPHYRTSVERYARGVWLDIKKRLAVEILKGSSVSDVTDELAKHGGPRGLVSLAGVAGEKSAVVELIPGGLFKRYRFWAERIVRTEMSNAYGQQMLDGLHAAAKTLPDLMKRWCADGGGCKDICQPADGQTVPLHGMFTLGNGDSTDTAPGHPSCRCSVGAWRPHWGEIFDSLGLN